MQWISNLSPKIKIAFCLLVLGKFTFLPAAMATLASKENIAIILICLYSLFILGSIILSASEWLNQKGEE